MWQPNLCVHNLLYRLKCEFKFKIVEEQRAHSLAHNILGVKGCARAPRLGLGRMISINYSHRLRQTKQQVG
jgi:hypothetical protein